MYQKLILVGRLVRDPEMRYTPNGNAVTNLSIAYNRAYTDSSGQKVDETTWFRVNVWGKQAESCNTYLEKGRLVLIEGELVPDKETGNPKIFTRSDGTPGSSFEINARSVRFLSSRSDEGSNEDSATSNDDIPF
jgi:single-strand DNA-binding protein